MAAWKLAPALAAGDTVVLKPSSQYNIKFISFNGTYPRCNSKGVVNLITGKGSTAGEFLKTTLI